MDTDNFQTVTEPDSPVYNIKHRSFYLAKNVIIFVGKQKYDRLYFSLFDQLIRSVSSIGANLVEGIAGASRKDLLSLTALPLNQQTKQSIGYA